MTKIIISGILLLSVGVLGGLFSKTSAGFYLEEEVGLSWLFQLRGNLPSPKDVIIVSLDQLSTEVLHLSDNPDNWSRVFYVNLLKKLNEQNPALIALNVHFGDSRIPDQDALLANEIKQNKNVVLSSYLRQTVMASSSEGASIYSEHIIEPIPEIGQAALDSAPFIIPKTSSTVKQFWTFKHSAGNIATLPVSVFQYFALKETYPEIMQILHQINQEVFSNYSNTFEALINQKKAKSLLNNIYWQLSETAGTIDKFNTLLASSSYSSKANKLLSSWLKLLEENERIYINYYGDVGTITTVPFYQVITPQGVDANLFRNKIVLVGYADGLEPEKQQGFYSVYSASSGKVITPIEIAGTAIANILDESWIKPISEIQSFWLIVLWGIFLSLLFRYFTLRIALIAAWVSVAGYLVNCCYVFSTQYFWLPIVIPLMQAALIMLVESVLGYRRIRKLSGYYLPKEVFANTKLYPEEMNAFSMAREGVCMATDAGQYTTLAESTSPLALHKLMNDYYASIFPVVKGHGGVISDVVGDSMLAIWSKPVADDKLKINVCNAALDIKSAVDSFNQHSPHNLDTRIGMHYGPMQIGNVGSMEHYEFRAVGDTVNTATRIEGLNKILGTRILVSEQVVEQIQGFFIRDVGTFLLKGKTQQINVYELIGYSLDSYNHQPHLLTLLSAFSHALSVFRQQQWHDALTLFKEIEIRYPGDGPTRFYIAYLQQNIALLNKHKREKDSNCVVAIDVVNEYITLKN